MDYIFIKNLFADYSLPVLVIATVVGIAKFFLDKVMLNKIPKILWSFFPFIACEILYIAFDMIFVLKAFIVNSHTLYVGIVCGSVSIVVSSTIRKIATGKSLALSDTVLLIEGLINGFIVDELLTKTAKQVDKILCENNPQEILADRVLITLKDNAHPHFSDDDLMRLTLLLIQSVNALKRGD